MAQIPRFGQGGEQRAAGKARATRALAARRPLPAASFLMNSPSLIDLHTHSHCSDGVLSPIDLVARAAARGVGLLALTDHDTVAGCAEARAACDAAGIRFVAGIEVSTSWRSRDPCHARSARPEALPGLSSDRHALAQRAMRSSASQRGRIAAATSPRLATAGLPTRCISPALVAMGHRSATGMDRWSTQPSGPCPGEWPALTTQCCRICRRRRAGFAHPTDDFRRHCANCCGLWRRRCRPVDMADGAPSPDHRVTGAPPWTAGSLSDYQDPRCHGIRRGASLSYRVASPR